MRDRMRHKKHEGEACSFAGNHKIFNPEWEEDLFRAICMDHAKHVKQIIETHAELKEHIDRSIFGIFQAKNKLTKKYELIAYGAHVLHDHDKCLRNAATALHVAAWKNAVKVARLLTRYGASTNKRDGLGVSAFDRAQSKEMQVVLRRPCAPRDVHILSCANGQALVQWTISRSRPRIDRFQMREISPERKKSSSNQHEREEKASDGYETKTGQDESKLEEKIWDIDATNDVEVYHCSDEKDGPVTCIFETPGGTIRSGGKHAFAVRCRNVDGFWSEWTEMDNSVHAKHWLDEWREEDERRERYAQELELAKKAKMKNRKLQYAQDEKKKHLILGSVSFGFVRMSEWYKRAQEEQFKAAAKIQALARAKRHRDLFLEKTAVRKKIHRRTLAAKVIQRFYKETIVPKCIEKQAKLCSSGSKSSLYLHDPTESHKRIMLNRTRQLRRRQEILALKIQKERERYKIMSACGYNFNSELPEPWK